MDSIDTKQPVIYNMDQEPLKLYRFRIWRNEDGEYRYDEDVYAQEVPREMVEAFHKPGEVYPIFADTGDEVDNESGAGGRMLLVLSDDKQRISDFVRGIGLAQNLDAMFDQ